MGLDAYVTAVPKNKLSDADRYKVVDVEITDEHGATDIAYWRKCRQLQGWMTECYVQEGGIDAGFNCATLRLTPEILDALELAMDSGELAAREDDHGFFWGGYPFESSDAAELSKVLAYARANPDMALFYHAWY